MDKEVNMLKLLAYACVFFVFLTLIAVFLWTLSMVASMIGFLWPIVLISLALAAAVCIVEKFRS